MKICEEVPIIGGSKSAWNPAIQGAHRQISEAIAEVVWPPGETSFSMNPTPTANQIQPIHFGLFSGLVELGWELEKTVCLGCDLRPRKFSAYKAMPCGRHVVVEFLKGDRTSMHRDVNDLAMGLLRKVFSAGFLVVPSERMGELLLGRYGSIKAFRPFIPVFSRAQFDGVLGLTSIGFDALSDSAPRLPRYVAGARMRHVVVGPSKRPDP